MLNETMSENIADIQPEVQRKFARCIFQLQQIELLLKSLVTHMSVQGSLQSLLSIREEKTADTRMKTMGTLVSLLTGELFTPPTREEMTIDAYEDVSSTNWASIKYTITMSDEEFEKTKLELVDLVEMRNGLVHHFIERFKLSLISECQKAITYLDECDVKISSQLLKLREWGLTMKDAQAATLAYMGTSQFENAILHSIMPDGAVLWKRSTIVEYLRNAEMTCAQDGWTLLDTAIVHIRLIDNEQTPSKYGCKTWKEVLRKSEQFETKKNVNSSNGKGQVWYRSHVSAKSGLTFDMVAM